MALQNESLIFQVQQMTVDKLKADTQLSALPVFAEDIKDIEFQIKNALGKQGIVALVMTPTLTYRGDWNTTDQFSGKKLAYECEDLAIQITENVLVNRANPNSITGQDAACLVANVLGLESHGQYSLKQIQTGEDDGLLVTSVTFKCLVVDDEFQPHDLSVLPLLVTENGVHQEELVAYSPVSVDVKADLEDATFTENGTYSLSSDYKGYGNVTVNVNYSTETALLTADGTYRPQAPSIGFSEVTVSAETTTLAGHFTENGHYQLGFRKAWNSIDVDVKPMLLGITLTADGTYKSPDEYTGYGTVVVSAESHLGTLSATVSADATFEAGFREGWNKVILSVLQNVYVDEDGNLVSDSPYIEREI